MYIYIIYSSFLSEFCLSFFFHALPRLLSLPFCIQPSSPSFIYSSSVYPFLLVIFFLLPCIFFLIHLFPSPFFFFSSPSSLTPPTFSPPSNIIKSTEVHHHLGRPPHPPTPSILGMFLSFAASISATCLCVF